MRFKNVCFVIACLLFVAVTVCCENKNHNFKEISEEEIEYADLPASVQTAFESSEYKDWEIEEVEKQGVLDKSDGPTAAHMADYMRSEILKNTIFFLNGRNI